MFATASPSPFRTVWVADWSKYRTKPLDMRADWSLAPVSAFEAWWQLELVAIRYADAHKKEARRQRNIAKYLPKAA